MNVPWPQDFVSCVVKLTKYSIGEIAHIAYTGHQLTGMLIDCFGKGLEGGRGGGRVGEKAKGLGTHPRRWRVGTSCTYWWISVCLFCCRWWQDCWVRMMMKGKRKRMCR